MVDHDGKHARRNRQIIERALCRSERLAQSGESCQLAIVAIDVLQQASQALQHRRIGILLGLAHALLDVLDELGSRPARARNANHRHRQVPMAHQVVERGKYFARAQISGRTKDHQRIGGIRFHQDLPSTWPPKPRRMAERTLFANSALPRESKRE